MTDIINKEDIFKLLPSLSQEDLKEILNRCSYLCKDDSNLPYDRYDAYFYQALVKGLDLKVKDRFPEFNIYKHISRVVCKKLHTVRLHLDEYLINLVGKNKVDRNMKKWFYSFYVSLMVRYIVDSGFFNLSLKTLIDRHVDFPGMIEKNFPSYIESNLFPLIYKKWNC